MAKLKIKSAMRFLSVQLTNHTQFVAALCSLIKNSELHLKNCNSLFKKVNKIFIKNMRNLEKLKSVCFVSVKSGKRNTISEVAIGPESPVRP